MAHQLLLIVHVLASMYWFGASTTVPRRMRGLLEHDRESARRQVHVLKPDTVYLPIAGLVVLLTGLAMVFSMGGFGAVAPRLHTGMLLTLGWIGAGAALIRPGTQRFIELVLADGPLEDARPLIRRTAMGIGIAHLLFVATTILMLWRI